MVFAEDVPELEVVLLLVNGNLDDLLSVPAIAWNSSFWFISFTFCHPADAQQDTDGTLFRRLLLDREELLLFRVRFLHDDLIHRLVVSLNDILIAWVLFDRLDVLFDFVGELFKLRLHVPQLLGEEVFLLDECLLVRSPLDLKQSFVVGFNLNQLALVLLCVDFALG